MPKIVPMEICLNKRSIADYEKFLKIKSLPKYNITGGLATFPDEYAGMIGVKVAKKTQARYTPSDWLFDYQREITRTAITKKKYSVFADCGLGKTAILLEFAKHIQHQNPDARVLIVSPLMVVAQTIDECKRFYGESLTLEQVRAAGLAEWMRTGKGIAITNYDAITDDIPELQLDGLILDESSMLKSAYGKWGTKLIKMGRGVEYKLCLTGTPAPNDRIEYANHAVFMDAFPTVNSFLARFFVNRGQTAERWELKKHALGMFYRALSHWCIFLTNPATYGWKDNSKSIPPIITHVHQVSLTGEQRTAFMELTGDMFVNEVGGIGDRGKIARLGKGFSKGERIESNKTQYIKDLVATWPTESTLIWCKYNQEQDDMAEAFPGCGNIEADTPLEKRLEIIADFKSGKIRVLVSKPKMLGFGLNLQVCTRQVFSGLQDSYEEFYQAVKRSNRYGSTVPLNVHIPITELEAPMVETVLSKAKRVQADTIEQERIFSENRI